MIMLKSLLKTAHCCNNSITTVSFHPPADFKQWRTESLPQTPAGVLEKGDLHSFHLLLLSVRSWRHTQLQRGLMLTYQVVFSFCCILNSFGMSCTFAEFQLKTGPTLFHFLPSPSFRHTLYEMEKSNYRSPPVALSLFIFNGKFEIVLSRELSLSHHMTRCN